MTRANREPARWQSLAATSWAIGPGAAVAAAIALAATLVARVAPVIGAPVTAIVLGLAVRLVFAPGKWVEAGIAVSSRRSLQVAIVLLGATLSLGTVFRVGSRSLPVMLGTLVLALACGAIAGRLLRIDSALGTLVTVGTAICGASAIGAVASVIEVEAAAIAYAISTIFVFNIVAVLVFPPIGHAIGLSQQAFGLWAGTAVNDTSSVVAAGYSFGHIAGEHAVVVKLARTLLLIPIVVVLAYRSRRRAEGTGVSFVRLVPTFLVIFLVASAANSAGLVASSLRPAIVQAAGFLIATALAAIGVSANLGRIRSTGFRPLLLGAFLWTLVATTSLVIQAVAGLK
jgi:uncharacterized integral membrane protein (TIGR00698 family)